MIEMHPIIKKITDIYFGEMPKSMQEKITGFCIYGSATMADFHYLNSDIDFVAITSAELALEEIKVLEQIHKNITYLFPKPQLNGIYITEKDIEKGLDCLDESYHYFEGKMGRGDFELNQVTWYQLKQNAYWLKREKEFTIKLNMDTLIDEMHQNLHEYWRNWIDSHKKILSLKGLKLKYSKEDIEWGILGICRQCYTFDTHKITSKKQSGEYMLEQVPLGYKKVIQEAISIRKGNGVSLYSKIGHRKKDCIECMEYLYAYAEEAYQKKNYSEKLKNIDTGR